MPPTPRPIGVDIDGKDACGVGLENCECSQGLRCGENMFCFIFYTFKFLFFFFSDFPFSCVKNDFKSMSMNESTLNTNENNEIPELICKCVKVNFQILI